MKSVALSSYVWSVRSVLSHIAVASVCSLRCVSASELSYNSCYALSQSKGASHTSSVCAGTVSVPRSDSRALRLHRSLLGRCERKRHSATSVELCGSANTVPAARAATAGSALTVPARKACLSLLTWLSATLALVLEVGIKVVIEVLGALLLILQGSCSDRHPYTGQHLRYASEPLAELVHCIIEDALAPVQVKDAHFESTGGMGPTQHPP